MAPKPLRFTRLPVQEVPVDADGHSALDLWVHLSALGRYVRWCLAGDELNATKLQALDSHSDPALYVDAEALEALIAPRRSAGAISPDKETVSVAVAEVEVEEDFGTSDMPFIPHLGPESARFLREPIREKLLGLGADFLDSRITPQQNLESLEKINGQLLEAIAPDMADLMNRLVENSRYLHLMGDTAAISAIAVLFAVAEGHASRSVFRELSCAAILMDLTLAEVPREDLDLYVLGHHAALKRNSIEIILKHPQNSHVLLSRRVAGASDLVGQLVLGHHELYSGRGYPRKLRSDLLAPLVRVLAFSVDCFETMKRASLRGETMELRQAVIELMEPTAEPHLRRHSRKLVENIHAFLLRDDHSDSDLSRKERGVR